MLSQLLPYLAQGMAAVFISMTFLWLLHFPLRNAAIVDVGWTYNLILLAGLYAWMAPGYLWRKVLIVLLVAIWGLRLGTYLLLTRVVGAQEEGRYKTLRESWKTNLGGKFFLFFQAQGVMDVILSLPFLIICLNEASSLGVLEWAGGALVLVGVIGETAADYQLDQFKKNPDNQGQVCQKGLWNYSRHPNYFFESLVWVGYCVVALASPFGYVAIIGPALIMSSIFFVTGIPPTEAQAVKSKGEAYRQYQKTTSAFVPWFKKTPAGDEEE